MILRHVITAATAMLLSGIVILIVVDANNTIDSNSNDFRFLAKLMIIVAIITAVTAWALVKIYGIKTMNLFFANFLLVAVTISISLGIAEMFSRYVFADITSTPDNTSFFAKRWMQREPPIVNSFGFREREFSRTKESDVYRIAVVGDSFTYGQGIKENERFTNVIESRLNEFAGQYEVLNFGRPGAETIDHLAFLDDFILPVTPDFVLLQWYLNDPEGHDKTGRPKVKYRLIPSDVLAGFLHTHSALYYLLNSKWIELQNRLGLMGSYKEYLAKRFKDPDSVDSIAYAGVLRNFIDTVKAKEIAMGIVLFPDFEDTGGKVENYTSGYLMDRVLEICREKNVPCIDLRSVYAQVSPATKLWVNLFDSHPGIIANKMASDAILNMFEGQWRSQE